MKNHEQMCRENLVTRREHRQLSSGTESQRHTLQQRRRPIGGTTSRTLNSPALPRGWRASWLRSPAPGDRSWPDRWFVDQSSSSGTRTSPYLRFTLFRERSGKMDEGHPKGRERKRKKEQPFWTGVEGEKIKRREAWTYEDAERRNLWVDR